VKGQGLLLATVSVVVAIAVVTGFLVLGSPGEARLQELDRKRVEDLRGLAMALAEGDSLPHDLSVYDWGLRIRMKNGWSPDDPVTGKRYGYRKIDTTHFDLCAVFDTEVEEADLGDWEKGWAHPKGAFCFRFDTRYSGVPHRVP
jgi:hypothetical protein